VQQNNKVSNISITYSNVIGVGRAEQHGSDWEKEGRREKQEYKGR
jgi:hypothetical protein